MNLVDLRHGADVARHGLGDLDVLLALQLEEVRELDRLARVADEQLCAGPHRALVHAEDAELADERVDRDLEDVREDVLRRVRADRHALGGLAFALQERRRVALGRVRREARQHVEQFGDAGAGLGRAEADRHQVVLAQRLLERIVQLLGVQQFLALLEVERHQLLVDLDDLVDDLACARPRPRRNRSPCRAAGRSSRRPSWPPSAGRLSGRQSLPKLSRISVEHLLGARLAASILLTTISRHRPRALANSIMRWVIGLDAVDGAHDDHGRLDRLERAQRAAEEVGVSRGVDHVDAPALGLEAADRGVERMQQGLFLRIEVADRGAAGERPLGPDCAGLREQGFGQQRLARAGLAHEGDIADVLGCVGHLGCLRCFL